jgi:hypothetical protein
MEPFLEFTDGAHPAVGAQELFAAQLHVSVSPVKNG